MINGIDHVGIAVKSLEERIPFYRDVLGLGEPEIEEVADQQVRTAIFDTGAGRVELLEPINGAGPIGAFLTSRGEGIHHIALKSTGIEQDISAVISADLNMIDSEPRPGAGGARIAFIHPKSTGSVLLELCERNPDSTRDPERDDGDV
ncbi:MAG: methylmalonyl-CoA epimerase [Alkalispirochaeta sp.]